MNKKPKPGNILTFQITHLIALIAFFFFDTENFFEARTSL